MIDREFGTRADASTTTEEAYLSLCHTILWAVIDAFAAKHGLSASGLAMQAGLDSTAFNKSKRLRADGRRRWPSTESIAKIIAATGADWSDFLDLVRVNLLPTKSSN